MLELEPFLTNCPWVVLHNSYTFTHPAPITLLDQREYMSTQQIKKIHPTRSIPFIAIHVLALAFAITAPFAWKWVGLCVGMYYLRMFAITGFYHRYFSHRTFKTSRAFQFFMAFLAQTSAQKGALWWAANHRHHHKFSDQEGDIHSPIRDGFWWSHCGWILSTDNDRTMTELIHDLTRFPELVWLNRYPHVASVIFGALILVLGGWSAFVWGFLVSTVLLWHGTFTINSLSHVYGSQRYETGDTSRNNFWLSLLTLGEGWHNNHHCYQSATRQGFFWYEIDITYYLLKTLSVFGIVWDLRAPPLEKLEEKRIGNRSAETAVTPLPISNVLVNSEVNT